MQPLQVLILEDLRSDAELMLSELPRAGFGPIEWHRAESEEEYLALLDPPPDVILADYAIPRLGAAQALRLLQERGLDIPFIVVTASAGEEVAVEFLKRGAADYVLKDRMARLGQAVKRALAEKQQRDDKRQAEAERQRVADSQARLIAIVDATTDFVGSAAVDGRVLHINVAMRRVRGLPDDADVSHLSIADFHPDWARKVILEEGIPAALRDGTWSGETAFLNVEGAEVPTSQVILVHRGCDGRVAYLSTVARDITCIKQVEEALRESNRALRDSEARYRTLVEAIDDAINVKDTSGRYVTVNAEFARRMGLQKQGILGKMPTDLYDADAASGTVERDLRVLGTGEAMEFEKRYSWRDGPRICLVRKLPLRDGAGEIVGLVSVSRDITERERMEEQLHRAQRLETAGRIAAQVAHDFNNLLTPLVAYPELIKMALPGDHPAVDWCNSMMDAAQQIAAINEDMMALGRRGHVEEEPFDLNQVVQQALERLPKRPDSLRIDLDLADDLLPVGGSSAQLLRVASNLLSNAREAMQDVGCITVRTENVYLDQPFGRYNRIEMGEYVRLEVGDTGPGIPLEIQSRIFDAFFSTKLALKRPGSGLGLSIVQAIVEDHRGYLDLESEAGKGALFSVYLPVCRKAVEGAPSEKVRGGNETVLLVDDDPLQREVTGRLLEVLGYRVERATGGEEAIAYVTGYPVDLLILDMIMPPGIDGAETYRRVLGVRPGQRAILLSGFAESERVREAQAMGAGAYLRKPVGLEKLARAVRAELDRDR